MSFDAEIGVLFLHHNANPVTLNNLESIRATNPDAHITAIGAGEALPDGYSLTSTPALLKQHQLNKRRSSDILTCSGFIQSKIRCEKWWIAEWDTFCSISVREYYKSVWHFPFVAAAVYRTRREKDWPWFRCVKDMPIQCRPFAVGAVPFLYLMSHDALAAVCNYILKKPFAAGNGELRFATIANKCGYSPCGYSPPSDEISWSESRYRPSVQGIYHPVKTFIKNPIRRPETSARNEFQAKRS